MKKQPYEELTGIVDVDELAQMLVSRETLRLLFAEMQTAAHATNNPLFEVYQERIAQVGKRTNAHIQSWYDRHSMQYSAGDDADDTQEVMK